MRRVRATKTTPRVTINCVADGYSRADERVIEFSFPCGKGGLIRFREDPDAAWPVVVEIYSVDAGVRVMAPDYATAAEIADAAEPVHPEADPDHAACAYCEADIRLQAGSWVDVTDGDGCSGDPVTGANENNVHVPAGAPRDA